MAGIRADQTMRIAGVRISTGNTAIDGTGALTSILTGASGGSRVYSVLVTPIATVTKGWIAFFLYDGTNNRFLGVLSIGDFIVSAPTAPPQGRPWSVPLPGGELLLPSTSYVLKACPYNSESFDLVPVGADLL